MEHEIEIEQPKKEEQTLPTGARNPKHEVGEIGTRRRRAKRGVRRRGLRKGGR